MANADAVKVGVGIDPDRRAYPMFIKSGLTDDQINHIYRFVYDPDAVGPSTSLDRRKIQEAALRFYDKPWDVDRHRDTQSVSGPGAQTPDVVSSSVQGWQRGQLHSRALGRRELPGRRWLRAQRLGETLSPPGNSIQPKIWMTGKRKLTWKPTWQESLTGSTVTC